MSAPDSPRRVMLDGRLLPADEARLSPLGEGFMSGAGLFETIKVRQGYPLFLAEHLARLEAGVQRLAGLGMTLTANPVDLAGIRERLAAVIAANPITDDVVKLVVFAAASGPGELILTRPSGYTAEIRRRGFNVLTVPGGNPDGPTAGLKALSALRYRLAREQAKQAGADEALLTDRSGRLLEGSICNVFVVSSGRVLTPPLDGGVLPGIVRGLLLRQGPSGLLEEAAISREQLLRADEIFLTNSVFGVMPVSRCDGLRLNLSTHPITRQMAALIEELESADLRPTT